jgi:RNA polymerase sporulation-specific sigma factor
LSKKKEKERQPLSSKELEDFLKKAKQGSREAQNRLIENYENLIYQELSNLTATSSCKIDESEKQDLQQEGRLAVLRAIEAYDKTKNQSFFYFAQKCIKNAMLDWFKKEQKAPTSRFNTYEKKKNNNNDDKDDGDEIFFTTINFTGKLIHEEDLEKIENIFKNTLSERERNVFELFTNGNSYKEIADALNITEKQVDNALRKAREKLKNNDKIKEIRERLLKNNAIIKKE